MKNRTKLVFFGFLSGLCNGLFGSGGGMVVVPFLQKNGLDTKKAHATAIFVILPLTVVSIIRYSSFASVGWKTAIPICVGGVAGSFAGARSLKKIPDKFLKDAFSIVMIIAAVRMVIS